MSAAAKIAAAQGFEVSGCDLQTDTPYLSKLQYLGSQIFHGHDVKHLDGVDVLAVTPAVFFQSAQHPELIEGKKLGIVMTWQQFMGQYLHKGRQVVAVAGAHGKSTTTAMAGLLLEAAGFDPIVEVGATVPVWHSNVRIGRGDYFVSEADEYYHNFLSFHPQIIILTMIELDHPEYFGSLDKIREAYRQFVLQLQPQGVLIYNSDDPQNKQLVKSLPAHISTLPYSVADFPKTVKLGVAGQHNRANAAAILKLAAYLKIDDKVAHQVLADFTGIGRRLELIGAKRNIKVFDDYANHPTSYAATMQAVKEKYPKSRIWAVIEPHTFSRPKATLVDYPQAFKDADQVIVSRIFPSREKDPGDFNGADISAGTGPKARYIPDFTDIAAALKKEVAPGDIILVMGSGDSYKLARQILSSL